jgi:hypothetical protein
MNPQHKKLRLLAGQKAAVLNSPPGYLASLEPLPEGVNLVQDPGSGLDFVHLFVRDREELEAWIDRALESVKYDGLLWVSYPKGGSQMKTDLNRDSLWQLLTPRGIRPVSQVAIDETWSALRFRPVIKD